MAFRLLSRTRYPPILNRPFIRSLPRFFSGEVDSDLSHQLNEEIKFENTTEKTKAPEFVKEFLESSSFKLEERLGYNKVTLSRRFGNENIKVVFSINDIHNTMVKQEEGETVEAEAEDEDDELTSFPVFTTVTIEKEDKGSLVLNTMIQDGYMNINGIRHFHKEHAEEDLYMGPLFNELDDDLQAKFNEYLEERGVDTALATFVPDYIDYKEQQEYIHWLKRVNEFVSN